MGSWVVQMLALPFVFVLPGTLVVWDIEPSWSAPTRVAVGCVLSCLGIPMASFVAAWLLGTSIHAWIPFAIAAIVSGAAGARLWHRRRGRA